MRYYFNGKIVDKKDIPDNAKLIHITTEEHYADDAYIAKQNKNSYSKTTVKDYIDGSRKKGCKLKLKFYE